MALLLFLTASLILPTAILISRNGEVMALIPMLLSSIGLALLLVGLSSVLRRINTLFAATVLTGLLTLCLLLRFLLGFLYDFTGRGFSGEFFAHINLTSLNVGLVEYRKESIILLGLILFSAYIIQRLSKRQQPQRKTTSGLVLFASAMLIYFGASASPELMLARAYAHYHFVAPIEQNLNVATIREQSKKLLTPIRGALPLPIEKNQLQASLPERPLNLILIYLESFNESLSHDPRFPGLSPAIDALKKRYHYFDNITSSAYVTIEGIANSQCGTLMNMEYANNALTSREGRLSELPCLGDVLHTAGYQQIYMGGAGLDFAGKGAFLAAHGYDQLYGAQYWDKQGFERFAEWGLADTDLYDQAFKKIQVLHAETAPFNLTLLTLGMHIPGFQYEGCPRYTENKDKQFLNAIHCTDFLLGQFMQKLEDFGILKDTLVYMQADHGVFPSADMLKLFADDFPDTRLLTLLALPASPDDTRIQAARHTAGSSVDTAASLLDLLHIKHNAGFVFGRSHFQPDTQADYRLTRRADYMDGHRIENDSASCTDLNTEAPVSLPLDNCEKQHVMRTLNTLNVSYAKTQHADNRVCELAVDVRRDPDSGAIEVKWGNQNLSKQFYWRGSKKRKKQIEGVYAVVIDAQNEVQQALYFEKDSEQDIASLRTLLKQAQAQNILLINNAEVASLKPTILTLWPEALTRNKVVYGKQGIKDSSVEYSSDSLRSDHHFVPSNCR